MWLPLPEITHHLSKILSSDGILKNPVIQSTVIDFPIFVFQRNIIFNNSVVEITCTLIEKSSISKIPFQNQIIILTLIFDSDLIYFNATRNQFDQLLFSQLRTRFLVIIIGNMLQYDLCICMLLQRIYSKLPFRICYT
ncbi:hypothetical protein D3C80_1331070 [compost metagenome]